MLWGYMSSQHLEARRIGGQGLVGERTVCCQAAQHQLQIGRRAFAENRVPHRLCCRYRSGLAQDSGLEVLQGLPGRSDAIARGARVVARGALAKPWWGDGGVGESSEMSERKAVGRCPNKLSYPSMCVSRWPDVEDQDGDVCTPVDV
jgi:hypothetical protein